MYNSNPILQELNQARNSNKGLNLQPIKNLMQQVKGTPNVQQFLLQQYPALQNVMNLSQNKGVSLEQIARIMAQQKGVDINSLINELQNIH